MQGSQKTLRLRTRPLFRTFPQRPRQPREELCLTAAGASLWNQTFFAHAADARERQ